MLNYYFPLEVDILENHNVSKLYGELGLRGFGAYIHILIELRRREKYRSSVDNIKVIARRCHLNTATMTRIIYQYELFVFQKEENTTFFSSPYLDRVMGKLEAKRLKLRDAGIKSGIIRNTIKHEPGSNHLRTEEKSKEEKSREEHKQQQIQQRWEVYIDQAMKEESWLEVVAMHSGFGLDFMAHKPTIIQAFKEHICMQGTENSILSLQDAKAYFANFIRSNTKTNQRIRELISEQKKQEETVNPYCFESIDPKTGERSYYGNSIPLHAPPRPSNVAVWDNEGSCWCQ